MRTTQTNTDSSFASILDQSNTRINRACGAYDPSRDELFNNHYHQRQHQDDILIVLHYCFSGLAIPYQYCQGVK